MSGGYFDYKQHTFEYEVVDRLKEIIQEFKDAKASIPKQDSKEDNGLFSSSYSETDFYKDLSDETLKEFENGLRYCQLAVIYAQRIDYLLSGDDGEETFHERLKKEIEKLEKDNS